MSIWHIGANMHGKMKNTAMLPHKGYYKERL